MAKLRGALGLFGFVLASVALLKLVFLAIDLRRGPERETIRIGSKAFTESIVLAEMMALLVEKETDLRVIRRTNLGGTHICFQALLAGEIDLYPEYTGTGLMAILNRPVVNDAARAFETVRRAFATKYDLVWLDPLSFDNTYALAMREDHARRLGIDRISDLARHPGLRAGFTAEFMARKDGYPGLAERYALSFSSRPSTMEAGLMYGALAEGKVDIISAYATDGRIDKLGLRLLEDDRGFFPPYQAAPLVRGATLREHPEIRRALSVLSGKLDDAEMRKINARVDLDKTPPQQVARDYLDGLLGD